LGEQGRWLEDVGGTRDASNHRARTALEVLARMLDMRDPYTGQHARDVAECVPRVGAMFGLSRAELEELELAARFHDIGKIAVPEAVLRKPGPLDDAERRVMACHVEWGAELLRHLPDCEPIAHIVRHHHEQYNGGGYPDGLADGEIPLASRIIAACDAYGAMVSDRPYRSALAPHRAIEELRHGSGSQFDPDAVGAVLHALDELHRENGRRRTN
jgi:HD-GYP domain-containing protein (c-di-GMP phosphodiesterase class II)